MKDPETCKHEWYDRIQVSGSKVVKDIYFKLCKAIGKEEQK